MNAPPLASTHRRGPWPWIVLALAVAAVAALGALMALRSLARLPADLAHQGWQAARELRRVAAAFRQGTVTHRFLSYATSVEGTTRLQVATLSETQRFVLDDQASTLWGTVDLPPVTVEATAPVEITYYVELSRGWRLRLDGRRVRVVAPRLRFNKPAIDASALTWEVRRGSLLRDEEVVMARLRGELQGRAALRAKEGISLVREVARRQVERFVRAWLLAAFDDAEGYTVEATFADEAGGAAPRPLVEGGPDR